jgi:hypothetical protein
MPQELVIRSVLNGWIVSAGCQTLVFNDADDFGGEFLEWLRDPTKVEGEYQKRMRERGLANPSPPPTATREILGEMPAPLRGPPPTMSSPDVSEERPRAVRAPGQ